LLELRDHRHHIVDLVIEGNVVAAPIETRDGDAALREDAREVAKQEVIATAVARRMQPDDDGMPSRARRQVELVTRLRRRPSSSGR
jgi:hypothetical protein